MIRIVGALLILSVCATACWQTNEEPTKVANVVPTTPSTPYPIPTATSTLRVSDGRIAATRSSFPTEEPTSTPTPDPSPTASSFPVPTTPTSAPSALFPTTVPASTPTPGVSPAPTASPMPITSTTPPAPAQTLTDEDQEIRSDFLDNFKSISYSATFNLTDDRLTDGGYPIVADVEGWVTYDQMFARIAMTRPVERSIEVLTHNSFDVYLNDIERGKWFFIPENSDAGPLEDILQLWFWGLLFSVPSSSMVEQSPDGYEVTQEDPSSGTITASYDQEYTLRSVVFTYAEGKETIRVNYFDLNKPHDIRPYQKGNRLPQDYWEPSKQ